MDQAEGLRNVIKMNPIRPQIATSRVITVTSGKGGVGKSNVSINLACQFRKLGQRVVILDADFGLANIEIMFGTVPEHNLCDLLYKGKNIQDVITKGPMDIGFISGGSGIAGLSNLTGEYLNYIVQNLVALDQIADVIIIDTGAGISDSVMDFLVASGEIIVVATPEPTSITDSYSLLKALNRHPRFNREDTKLKVIANKVKNDEDGKLMFNKLNSVVTRYLKLPVSYLGAIPEDSSLSQAVMQQMPVSIQSPGAKSSRAFEKIAYSLMDKNLDKNNTKSGMTAFFSHLIQGNKKTS